MEVAVEEMLCALDDHEFSTDEVAKLDTLAFWDGVLVGLRERRAALKRDLQDGSTDDDADEDEDEPTIG